MFIATLVAKETLSAAEISEAADRLRASGLIPFESRWLEEGKAADLAFEGDPKAGRAALETHLGPVDVIVQAQAHRHRKLLVADMDSTMITVECIDELADYAGIKAEIAEITERAMRGELDFEEALTHRVNLLAGLTETIVAECLAERVKLMPGGKALLKAIHANDGYAVLVSGGFTHFAEPVGAILGFDKIVANQLGFVEGRLDGSVARPIIGAQRKSEELNAALTAFGWGRDASLAVGDGANDIPMIEAAGLGVAYHAKPKTQAAASAAVLYGDLEVLAYAVAGRALSTG